MAPERCSIMAGKTARSSRTADSRLVPRACIDLTRSLIRAGRDGVGLLAGAYMGIPPVNCGAGHSVTYISMLAAREREIHRAATRTLGTASTVPRSSLR